MIKRYAANYVFPVNKAPIKNGIVEVNQYNEITNIIDNNGLLVELPHTEFYNGIIVPGLINMHTHIELSHLRQSNKNGDGLPAFIKQMILSKSKASLKDIKQADVEMYKKGIVAVVDISNTVASIPIKKNSKILYHTCVEIAGLDESKSELSLKKTLNILKQFKDNKLSASIVPHAPYSISNKLWHELDKLWQSNNSIISIHNQESNCENRMFIDGSGKLIELFKNIGITSNFPSPTKESSLKSVGKYLSRNPLLLVHNIYTTKEDIEYIKSINKNRVGLVICPNSNLYIENKIADLDMLINTGIPLMLGTDSRASASNLSILSEMITLQNHTSLSFDTILGMATTNATTFLDAKKLGTIEVGQTPGLNLINNFDFRTMKLTTNSTISKLI